MKLLIGVLLLVASTARAHLIHVPEKFDPKTAAIVVVIHGCLQAAESMALGTGFNREADASNWIVLYPQVPAKTSPINCWSWFDPANQGADRGQLKMIMNEVDALAARYGLRDPKVYVTGISSGGATAAGLAACFPKQVRAVALHSAPLYGSAKTLAEADKVLREGPAGLPAKTPCETANYPGGTLILHGEKDNVVDLKNAELSYAMFANSDPKRGELIRVPDLEHAWAGFKPTLKTEIPFFSPKGPDATALISTFFRKY